LAKKKAPKVFYVSGEESPSQISLRIDRFLKNYPSLSKEKSSEEIDQILNDNLVFITSTDVDEINLLVQKEKPDLLIVDSIQTISTSSLTGASGSVGQIRESSDRIINTVKAYGIPTFMVGHITKDGTIAGPKVLEHMVDAVLLLEGERSGQLRLLRSLKNRFGATDEVGIFQAEDYGFREVANPSELFLENTDQSVVGAATVCLMEGTRPLLAEVQALVVKSQLAMPRRVGRGIELSRIQILSAVLQKHTKLPLGFHDVFLSVAGGFKIKEASVDLGLAVAIASSISGKKIPQSTVFIGEIGLLGEVRKTPYFDRRAKEARRLGFKKVISKDSHKTIFAVLKDLGML
jgi:DNA repair protein RadA/Sms